MNNEILNKALEVFFAVFFIAGLTIGAAYLIRLLCHLFFDKIGHDEDEIDG